MMRTGVVAAAVLLMALTACSGGERTETAIAAPSATSTPVPEGQVFCNVWWDGNGAYVDWISSAAIEDVDINEFYEQQAYVQKLRFLVPAEAKADVEEYAGPVDAVQASLDAGGGALSFSTDGFKAANTTLVTYCTERTD